MANDTRRAIARKSDYGTGFACVFCCLTLCFFPYAERYGHVPVQRFHGAVPCYSVILRYCAPCRTYLRLHRCTLPGSYRIFNSAGSSVHSCHLRQRADYRPSTILCFGKTFSSGESSWCHRDAYRISDCRLHRFFPLLRRFGTLCL